jgi:fimbrial chaperone protein
MSLRSYFALRSPIALAVWLAATLAAQAASLQVAPTSVQLTAEESAQGLWLSNSGDKPLQAQVRVFRWHQKDGEDLLDPSDKIAISPSLVASDSLIFPPEKMSDHHAVSCLVTKA